jgi:hypothetical protein
MNSNSISHRLFASAVLPGTGVPARPAVRPSKAVEKHLPLKPGGATTGLNRKPGQWSWSGWQQTII